MLAEIINWFKANETVLSGVAAAVVVLSIVGAAMRGALTRGATSFVVALRSRREVRANLSEIDVSQPVPGFGGRPAIAVLPFDNMSGDPEQEYFADGITEDIITNLQSFRTFPVIARNSSFSYKGTSPDVRTVAKELGVGYVLEGSVRRSGDQIRITAQLIDASGHHVWAERFDRDFSNVLQLQDEITLQIAGAIAPEIDKTDVSAVSRKRSKDLAAWDYFLQAQAIVPQIFPEALRAARDLLEKAIELDPQFAQAFALLARIYFYNAIGFGSQAFEISSEKSFNQAMEHAKRALSIDSSIPLAHGMLTIIHVFKGQPQLGLKEGMEAIRLNPSDPHLHVYYSGALDAIGDFDGALEQTQLAQRLSPHDPGMWEFLMAESFALFGLGRYEDAERAARESVEDRQQNPLAQAILIASLSALERTGEAREAYGELIRILPDFDPKLFAAFFSNENLSKLYDGLRSAGWDG